MKKIDLDEAKEMVARYQATRKELIDSTYGINDTKSIWIPAADIKNFANNLPEEATGIRIYLAAYSTDTQSLYPNQTTIVTIPTISSDSGADIDSIESENPLSSTGDIGPVNHEAVCPPICPVP